ncbi:MAG TPA: CheR family methyltransferase [Tepidisphaeraceae bacterium]|jgi:chemotaxis protein methyltransferase CheR|nr:CheR family methyltransferase [Tepidisphaeraceae bacterium]
MLQTNNILDTQLLARLSDLVVRVLGLNFPPSRWPELSRGIQEAAEELGFTDAGEYAHALLSSPLTTKETDALAAHLTVAETYFFRDEGSFDALANLIIPSIANAMSGKGKGCFRIWCAACCTGEEPYSIAILLREMIPNLNDWDLTLLATDINPCALRAAEAGIFGKWSFRNTPDRLKNKYFRPAPDGRYQVIPEIKRLVRFAKLNLAEEGYPSPANNTTAMDLILCRNVLIYFEASQARGVVERLYRAQADGGWLLVSPAELPYVSTSPYAMVNRPGAILCHKTREAHAAIVSHTLCDKADVRTMPMPSEPLNLTVDLGVLVQSLADQGDLPGALAHCDEWLMTNKLDAPAHYLRAIILQEQGSIEEASRSLRRALYLDPHLVLAHFALSHISRSRGLIAEAEKHLGTARCLAARIPASELLPQSGGVTAGRLSEMISLMTDLKMAA